MISVDELVRLFGLSKQGENLFISNLGNVDSDKDSLLTFAENAFYLKEALSKPNVKVVITKDEFRQAITDKTLLFCNNPKYFFFTIHNYLAKETNFYGELQKSKISSLAQIHPTAFIADKGVFIDDNVIIGPNVTILERTHIEKNVTIQAGAVIGSEGFEYKRFEDKLLPVIHAGGVYLEQGVEVGANNCIDKSIFGDFTRIGQDTKLDNLVHIAHNCHIGKRCLITASNMFAGSVIVEDDVFIGPASAIRPQVRIGRGATVSIGSVVTKDVPAGTRVTGNFALEHEKFMAFIKSIR